MIDELTLIKGLLGDLTRFGGWAFAGYIAYSLAKMVFIYGGIGYIINKVITLIFDYIKCPVTKKDYKSIQNRKNELQSRNDELVRQVEKVKHQYKILKEKADDE